MRTHVRFRSGLFKPIKPEEEQANPGVYGEELSKWLFDKLPHYGMITTEGWNGEKTGWICFCEPCVGLFERIFKKTDPKPALEETIEAMRKLIESEPAITDVEWYVVDKKGQEFDHAPVP